MPGSPFSASTAMPESSARAGRPVAFITASAFRKEFSSKVVPVSSTSMSTPSSDCKISRIVARELPEASREVLLVLDGTTGQNGLIQAKQFKEFAGVTAVALTKLDGTAKGGIVIAVADSLQIPVKFIGVGEQAEDLMPFEAEPFVEALL